MRINSNTRLNIRLQKIIKLHTKLVDMSVN